MLQPRQLRDVSARYPDEIAELRDFLQTTGCVPDTRESLHAVALRLQQDRAFRRDLTSYLWVVMHRAPRNLRYADTLGALAIAAAGEDLAAQSSEDDTQSLFRFVMDARQALEGTGGRDETPIAAPVVAPVPRAIPRPPQPELVPPPLIQREVPQRTQPPRQPETFLSPARPAPAQFLDADLEETDGSRKRLFWIAACALIALSIGLGLHFSSARNKVEAPAVTASVPAEPASPPASDADSTPAPHNEPSAPPATAKASPHAASAAHPSRHTPEPAATRPFVPAPAPPPAVASAAPRYVAPASSVPARNASAPRSAPVTKSSPSGSVVPNLGIAPASSASDLTNIYRNTQPPHLARRTPEERGELIADNRAPDSVTARSAPSGPAGTVRAVTLGSTASRVLYSPTPAYPAAASSAHVQGEVKLQATVDRQGNVASVRVISGPPLLREAALDAAQRWRYRPNTADGEPTTMSAITVFAFQLPAQ